ncbi:hypothetical protein [Sphingobium sp. MK2]|uniref:acyltransferase n=1 Tax=Sphingobium sp. MK2 TaxID=3116540 RepID=UPI0032E35B99
MLELVRKLFLSTCEHVMEVYPFGEIDVGQIPSGGTPKVVDGADYRRATNKGAVIALDSSAICLRGLNKTAAVGSESVISVGANSILENCTFTINGDNSAIIIGENCRLRGLMIKVSFSNSVVVIGSHTTWEGGVIFSESGNIVAIGNDCMASSGVMIRTTDGHAIFDAKTRKPLNMAKDVFVGHHVWLGNSSRIHKGAKIGSGTVLGQSSIASAALKSNAIYAGAPARKIRDDIAWSRSANYADIPAMYIPDMP